MPNANTYLPPTPVIPGMLLITGISRGRNMIVQFVNSIENTYREGQVVVLTVPYNYGMFQANGNQGKILKVFFRNFILDIDSRQYDKFVIPSVQFSQIPASLAPGGSRNLEYSNFTRLVPFQNLVGNIVMANPGITIKEVVFSVPGTYTYIPSDGMTACIIEVTGSGGGGGNCIGGLASISVSSGGGSGGYSRGSFSPSDIGTSQIVTVGAGGAGGNPGNSSSVGSLISANGGSAGIGNSGGVSFSLIAGGSGSSIGTGGDFNIAGQTGGTAEGFHSSSYPNTYIISGYGGSSFYGLGAAAIAVISDGSSNGNNGKNYGSGGGGAYVINTAISSTGGSGASGLVIITEFII